ncbi:MAG: peptidylprolyl isomerase [Synechococcus sp.]
MVKAKVGDTVLIHLTGKLKDGTVFDSTLDSDPAKVCIGAGEVVPGLDQALVGMTPGEHKVECIPYNLAYGPHHSEKVLTVNRHSVFPNTPVEVGQKLERTTPNGEPLTLTVVAINKSKVTLDANHVLAGRDLIYEINFLEFV